MIDSLQALLRLAGVSLGYSLVRTVVLVTILLVLRKVLLKIAAKALKEDAVRVRTFDVQLRFGVIVIGTISVIAIWAPELRTLALSLTALAASLLVVGKDIFIGVAGSFTRGVAGIFKVGDIIEIDGHRGEVVDHGFFATTLAELRPGRVRPAPDARLLTIPNSLIVSRTTIVETGGGFIQKVGFALPVEGDARQSLLDLERILEATWAAIEGDVAAKSTLLAARIRNEVLPGRPECFLDLMEEIPCIRIEFWCFSKDAMRRRNEITLAYLELRK